MERKDLVSFRQNDLPSSSFAVFEEMRKKKELCDITIKAENYTFVAHRVILAAAVPYFRSVFSSDGSVSKGKEIAFAGINPTVLESLIDFAYTSRINISAENAQTLLVASELLQVDQVKDACVEFLSDRLDVKNVAQVRTFALKHENTKLIESTKIYMQQNFKAFSESDDFLHLPHSCVKEIISGDDLRISKEEIVFEAVMNWVKFLPSERGDSLPELLNEVRMVLLPIRYLINTVAKEELIRSSTACMCLVQKVQSYHLLPKEESSVLNLKTQPRIVCNVTNGIYAICYSSSLGYSVYDCDFIKHRWNIVKSDKLELGDILFGAAAVNGSIYLFLKEKIARFHLKSTEWEILKPTHVRIGGAAILSHESMIYCFGSTYADFQNKVRCFDTRLSKWLEEGKMICRSYCSAASMGESVYVTGGHDSSHTPMKTVEQYSPATKEWKVTAPMLYARECHGCATLNGKIYVCGGYSEAQHLNTAEVFDPVINKWNSISPKVAVRGPCALIPQNNKMFAFRQNYVHDEIRCDDFEFYDPEKEEWVKSSFSTPRGFLSTVLVISET